MTDEQAVAIVQALNAIAREVCRVEERLARIEDSLDIAADKLVGIDASLCMAFHLK